MHACRSGLKFPPHHPDTHQPPLLGRSHVFGSGAATSCCVMYYETGAGRHHSTDRPACCPPPHAAIGWVAANEGPISTAARPLKPHGLAAVHEQQQQCNGGLATPPPPHPGPHQTLCSWGASHLQQARRRTTTTTSADSTCAGSPAEPAPFSSWLRGSCCPQPQGHTWHTLAKCTLEDCSGLHHPLLCPG